MLAAAKVKYTSALLASSAETKNFGFAMRTKQTFVKTGFELIDTKTATRSVLVVNF